VAEREVNPNRLESREGVALSVGDRVYHEDSDRHGIVEKINVKRRRAIVRFEGEKYGSELFGSQLSLVNF
jgi:hypothetical protein